MTPAFKITLNDDDITQSISDRLISLTLQDNRGFVADWLELCLDDADGLLALPRRGVILSVWLGYDGEPLIDKGDYIVSEVRHAGAPDTVSLRARSADLKTLMSLRRNVSYHDTTLGDIVKTIAVKNSLEHKTTPELAAITIEHSDQTESDINFLTRLADEHGAVAMIKKGTLLFIKTGTGTSASGDELPSFVITRSVGDSHDYSIADRDEYTAVTANYFDKRKQKAGSVTYTGAGNVITDADSAALEEENIFVIRYQYANKTNATRAAKARYDKLKTSAPQFSINLAEARPDLFPEINITVQGFKPEIDAQSWLVKTIQHGLSASGFTSSIELEAQADEDKDEEPLNE